ncbi:Thymidine kinase [Thermaerobacter marianensis DSM 12885]|uniref:Thymidine kinase n=1 Tax=Thermaerobacter marianensis (strain ATCC 700841 / DSM 12885 / JCM 10246 / 7p75a) TaxID=644966 RepID=E6SLB7_THEM7|nr:Thymidine kinase [Thermaerobacter marianensis DSM 12885]
MAGYLEVITGGMFSGKTEELLRRVQRARIARRQVLLCKPDLDHRYRRDAVASHDGRDLQAAVVPAGRPEELLALARAARADVVGIDEAQFFAPGIVPTVLELVAEGRRVIVSGLDMDFARRPFGPMPELMAVADEVVKLKAICVVCGEPATFTQRLIGGRPAAPDDPVILIGGQESYEPRCRRHHQLAPGENPARAQAAPAAPLAGPGAARAAAGTAPAGAGASLAGSAWPAGGPAADPAGPSSPRTLGTPAGEGGSAPAGEEASP